MKFSNTKLDTYERCPRFYKFRYVEKVKGNFTSTPLLYGSAMDAALNFILECIRDKVPYSMEQANKIFVDELNKWSGQNPLRFFINEVPDDIKDHWETLPIDVVEKLVLGNLLERGLNSLEVYEKEILPLIDEVLEVQTKAELPNEEGDVLEIVVDAVVKLKDGRVVLLDNKTSSSKYPKNKVIKSQQLSLYLENYPDIKYAGYAVLIKNPEKTKGVTYQFMVDEIPEETKADAFNRLETVAAKIKAGEFPCNYKSCKAFGQTCEYENACSYGNYEGLIPTYEKK